MTMHFNNYLMLFHFICPFVYCSSIILVSWYLTHLITSTLLSFICIHPLVMCLHKCNIICTENSFDSIDLSGIDEFFDVCEYTHLDSNDLNVTDDLFKVIHLNICGLTNKQEQVSRLLHALGGSNKVSALTLNETWLQKDLLSHIKIPSYDLLSKPRLGRKGGGVGILIDQSLHYRLRDDLLIENCALESIVIELKLDHTSLLIGLIYRPPDQTAVDWIT